MVCAMQWITFYGFDTVSNRFGLLAVVVHFNTATLNSTNFASKLFYYVFFNL